GSLSSPRTRAAASKALTFFSLGLTPFCVLGSAFSVFVFLVFAAAAMMLSLWVFGNWPDGHRQAEAHEGRAAAAKQAIFRWFYRSGPLPRCQNMGRMQSSSRRMS